VTSFSKGSFFALLAVLCFLSPPSARSEEDKPVVSIKTKYIEININIEPALRAYPKLYQALITDSKEDAQEQRKEALESWKTDPALFREQRWTFDRSYRLRVAALPYVSVLIDTGTFTGGAHPNTLLGTLLWDSRVNRRVEAESLFRETQKSGPTTTALAKLVHDSIIEEKKKRDVPADEETERWLEPIKADFSTLGAPSLAPSTVTGRASGMTFHFSPYGVGPYAEGSYTAFVPFSALEPYLTDEAKKIFAGERPKSDEDE
jgi:hypothetical protein